MGYPNDEIGNTLKHNERGIISMANNGPNTGGSQFFFTFNPTPSLDHVYSVFGQLIGGNEVLNKLELIKTDIQDKPIKNVRILNTIVFKNPFTSSLIKQKIKIEEKKEIENAKGRYQWNPKGTLKAAKINPTIGKYMKPKTCSL